MHSATGKENVNKYIKDKRIIISVDNVKCDNNDNGSFLLAWKTRMDDFLLDWFLEHVDAEDCDTISGNMDGISDVVSSLCADCAFEDFNKEECGNFIFSSDIRRMNIMRWLYLFCRLICFHTSKEVSYVVDVVMSR